MSVEDYGGLKLHTQAMGCTGSGILLLHGLLVGSLSTWYFGVAPALGKAHRVLMFDLRGHGLTPATADGYGVRSQAGDLGCVIDRHATAEPVALVGHSAGGAIALRYALDHPERVSKLVLVETPLPLMTAEWLERMRNASPLDLLKLLPMVRHASAERGGRPWKRMLEQLAHLANGTSLFADLLAEPDFDDDELAMLEVPLLLCYATRGGPVVTATRERLAARVPDARLCMLEGGHALPVESPGPLAATILDFCHG